ncbi:MAG: thioredoxin family protein [Lactimicrobium sp.]|jgi:thiol-disulfide isomerase/thioredoxin|uniref:TlpA family protein disulfide reductase n=1 Tax=Lactimicrobium sp. TaxID=2563780 RepID=UPI002F352A66
MKKKLIACALLTSLALTGCTQSKKGSVSASASASTATGNNAGSINLDTSVPDLSAYVFLKDDNPAFLEISTEESLKLFTNGTGIVFYSYETCPWCNRVIPVLDEAAKEAGITVFYVNIYSDDFMSKTDSEKSEIIQSLYTCLDPILTKEKDSETGEEKPVMQVPEVVAVKDGRIVGHHLGVVDGFTLDTNNLSEYQVTDDQVKELKNIYLELFKEIQ